MNAQVIVPCCIHGNDEATCGECGTVRMTPRDFITLYNTVWAMTYALGNAHVGPEPSVLKACHDELADIVLRYADTLPDFHKAHDRFS